MPTVSTVYEVPLLLEEEGLGDLIVDSLRLNATDMDLDIIESVACDISQPGATTAPAHTLYDIVRKLPEEDPQSEEDTL